MKVNRPQKKANTSAHERHRRGIALSDCLQFVRFRFWSKSRIRVRKALRMNIEVQRKILSRIRNLLTLLHMAFFSLSKKNCNCCLDCNRGKSIISSAESYTSMKRYKTTYVRRYVTS